MIRDLWDLALTFATLSLAALCVALLALFVAFVHALPFLLVIGGFAVAVRWALGG